MLHAIHTIHTIHKKTQQTARITKFIIIIIPTPIHTFTYERMNVLSKATRTGVTDVVNGQAVQYSISKARL